MALESSELDDSDDLENSENRSTNSEEISPPIRADGYLDNGSGPVEPGAGDDYSSTLWNSGAQRAFSLVRGNVEQRARATVAGIFDGDNDFGIIGSALSAFKKASGNGNGSPTHADTITSDGGTTSPSILPAAVIRAQGARPTSTGNGSGSGTGSDGSQSPAPGAEDAPAHPVVSNGSFGSLIMRSLGAALPLAANERAQATLTDRLQGSIVPAPGGSQPEGGDATPPQPPVPTRHPPTAAQGAFSLLGLDFTLPTVNPAGAPPEPPRAGNAHAPKQLGQGGDVGNGDSITPDTASGLARVLAGAFSGQLSSTSELNARHLQQSGTVFDSSDESSLKKLLAAGGRTRVDQADSAGTGPDTGLVQNMIARILNPGSPVPSPPSHPHPGGSAEEPLPSNPIPPPTRRSNIDVQNSQLNVGDGAGGAIANQIVTVAARTIELTAGETSKGPLVAPLPAPDTGNGSPAPRPSFTPDLLQNLFRNFVQAPTDSEPPKELRRVIPVTEDNGTPIEINRFQNALRNLLHLEADATTLPKVEQPSKVVPSDNSPLQSLVNQLLPRTTDRPSTDPRPSATLTDPLPTNMAALLNQPTERNPSGSPDVSGQPVIPRLESGPARLLDLIAQNSSTARDKSPTSSPEGNESNESSLLRMLVAAMTTSALRSDALPGAVKLSTSLLARESVDPTVLAGVGIKITEAGRLLFEPARTGFEIGKPGFEIGRVLTAGEIARLLQSIELSGRSSEIGKGQIFEVVGKNEQVTIGRFIGLIDAGKSSENVAISGLDGRFTAGLDGRSVTRGGHIIGGLEIQVDKSGRLIISELTTTKEIGVVVASSIEIADKRSLGGKPDGRFPLSEITGGIRSTSETVTGITITIGKDITGEKGIRGSGRKKDPDEEEDEASDSTSNGGLGFFGTTGNGTSQTDPQNQTGTGVDPQTQINISQIDPNSILPGVTIVMGGPATDPATGTLQATTQDPNIIQIDPFVTVSVAPQTIYVQEPEPCHTPMKGPDSAQLDASLLTIPADEVRLSWRDGDRFSPDNTATDRAVHAEDFGPIASAIPVSQLVESVKNQAPETIVHPVANIDQQPIQWKQQADPYIAAPDITDPFDMRRDLTEEKVPDCRIDLKDEKEDELERMRCWKEREAKRVMDTLAADQATRKNQRLFVEENTRTRYIVRPGDSLESIAQKILHDGRLALLIFRINRAVIRVEYKDNKQIIHLKPNTVLQIPTRMEIEIFRATLGSKRLNNTREVLDVTTRINYTVRLGDNLRTVASKHPALKDATLWPLIAEINGLSTDVNAEGSPAVRIQRGTTLRLPSTEEIAEFRLRQQSVVSDAV